MAVGVKYALQLLIDVFSSSSKVKKLSSFSISDISIVLFSYSSTSLSFYLSAINTNTLIPKKNAVTKNVRERRIIKTAFNTFFIFITNQKII